MIAAKMIPAKMIDLRIRLQEEVDRHRAKCERLIQNCAPKAEVWRNLQELDELNQLLWACRRYFRQFRR